MVRFGQQDRSIHNQLPPPETWPEIRLPDHLAGSFPLNCIDTLLTRHIASGRGDRIALRSDTKTISYAALHDRVCRMAALLQQRYGIQSGARVLLRGANSIEVAVSWLAVQQCGAIAVTTLSMLRARELSAILEMATPALCICECELEDELTVAAETAGISTQILLLGGEKAARDTNPDRFVTTRDLDSVEPTTTAFTTLSDDIALIGFTSGTTGKPKATIHFHRDVIAVCEIIADRILGMTLDDVVVGTAPLAFTFGLGGLLLFPLYAGSTSVLNGRYSPDQLLQAISQHRATICFTVPTFYQRMARMKPADQTASLRLSVCSGEALPARVRQSWQDSTGLALTEFLGSTEMLHAFVGSSGRQIRAGAIGRAFPGYEVAILGPDGSRLGPGEIGRFAVKGPTGCRYLADSRQADYVQDGWNITGDACSIDEQGYVIFHARSDDMIISSGYNISGVEVEDALLCHGKVAECAVIAEADDERGSVVTAYVVLKDAESASSALVAELQAHVADYLAPYKYPRVVRFVAALPRNESGKIQRFRLRSSSGPTAVQTGA